PMDTQLREDPEQPQANIDTYFDYGSGGFMSATEKCNGSGDCRKLPESGGTMCPSYQATKDEKHSTRARANALRSFIGENARSNRFNHPELKEVLDLCLSCKGCTRECPSNVDMAGMKAEWQYQYYKSNRRPLRDYALGHIDVFSKPAGYLPWLVNGINRLPGINSLIKYSLGIAPTRPLPTFASPVHRWYLRRYRQNQPQQAKGKLYLFLDEFTNYQDTHIGKAAIALLWRLGYEVLWIKHASSGRSQISKGLLESARQRADKNVAIFADLIDDNTPLVGIEPSAILGFRDEYPQLVSDELKDKAKTLSPYVLMIDEFLSREIENGRLSQNDFRSGNEREALIHGHCHQKALSSLRHTKVILQTAGYKTTIIPSGCCGMAGSFGYEKEHHKISMDIGEMVLFPFLRNASKNSVIIAPGTSCRHQIMDGTRKTSRHWIELV
ncbi:MAG: 4Fe-4S dicluster domain-containing protein, partial [Cryomorphaceae bacterium]|nr:4Fe-4S dicluster domain-containing protein [Cryomorphaceae bacterium]